MSDRPRFDDAALLAALSPGRVPATFDRVGRVALIGEAARALLDHRLPDREAALFLGGALLAWLENGGDLAREYLKVVKAKSHQTPAALWREMNAHQDERQDPDGDDTLAPIDQ